MTSEVAKTVAAIDQLADERQKRLMAEALKHEAEKPFGTRVQLAYDYDKHIYIFSLISEFEVQWTKEVTLELAFELFDKWHTEKGLPIYAYGAWLAREINNRGYPALWF